jgi:hypothetical protein
MVRLKSSPVCGKLSVETMAVECNPHRCLDREEIRYFDEQAAMQRQLGRGRSMSGW